jgi:3-demethoxyubiquinol 3-hydroxylase
MSAKTNHERSATMLRVDQAGEYGATRIYAGQLAVMGTRAEGAGEIAAMASQEAAHLDRFNALIAKRGVRPTALQPVWHVAGFALGAATALIGPKAAMACTAAIEEEIDRHYTAQLGELGASDGELSGLIETFRDDERAHRDAALAAGAEQAPLYPLLSGAIRLGCRVAIRLSEKI